MKNSLITSSGVKVYRNWVDNIIVDSQLPAIQWKAQQNKDRFTQGKAKGLSKLASVNSEDACSWNVFRSLERAGSLNVLMDRLGFQDDAFRVLYWYRLFDQQDPADEIQSKRLNLKEFPLTANENKTLASYNERKNIKY